MRHVRLEPLLEAISDFLDDQQQIVDRVRRDLAPARYSTLVKQRSLSLLPRMSAMRR